MFESSTRPTGTVAKWVVGKGYGFISSPPAEEAFAHVFDVEGRTDLVEGELVEYDLIETERGPRAKNIRRVTAGGSQ